MAIEQSKTSHYEKAVVSRGRTYSESVYPWQVHCDFCTKAAYQWGETAGDAADCARKDGFVTIKNKVVALPSKWACKACKEAMDKGTFVAKKRVEQKEELPLPAPLVDAMKQAPTGRNMGGALIPPDQEERVKRMGKPARVPAPPIRRNVSR